MTPSKVTRGYIEFFEPDAYVEAHPGLLEEAGLGAFRREHGSQARVVSLAQLITQQHNRDWAEPSLGLSVIDPLQNIYDEEQRFQLRKPNPALLVEPLSKSLLTESIFGSYPRGKTVDYFRRSYENVYESERVKPSPVVWRRVFNHGAVTPLRLTRYKLESRRAWHDEVIIFVFDPASSLDAIDLWNMRLERRPLLPLPVEWWSELLEDVRAILKEEHRPIKGNPQGIMHHGTVEFARSIDEDRAKALIAQIGDMPQGSVTMKTWRTPIWKKYGDEEWVHRESRLEVTAEERRVELTVNEEHEISTEVPTVSPPFAQTYGLASLRWTNVLSFSYVRDNEVATVLPFNTFDPRWPNRRLMSSEVLIGTEGWSLGQQFKDLNTYLPLLTPERALTESLGQFGIKAQLSEPGHIAKQILEHVGGMWGVYLLKDSETLMMLNNMAGGIRRRGTGTQETEELFDRRSKSVDEWQALIARRLARHALPRVALDDFTNANMIRVGIKTECVNCHTTNWHSLAVASYDLVCERCQKNYGFPQAKLQRNNANWAYRAVGPFAVPDYARGSFGALLALNVIDSLRMTGTGISFSTAVSLEFEDVRAEADYAGWWISEGPRKRAPELVIGEAKSFGTGDLITRKDIAKLRHIASKLRNAAFVISVMRETFTENEKKLIIPFVNWCRRPNDVGLASNNVILLTSNELFFNFTISSTWEKLGQPHAKFAVFEHTQSLRSLANATQQIYLGMPDFWDHMRAERERHQHRRSGGSAKMTRTKLD